MQCPNCLGDVPSAAKACRRCGHAFSAERLEEQAAFEKRARRAAPYVVGLAILIVLVLLWTCTRQQAGTPGQVVAARRKPSFDRLAVLKFQAEGTAAEAVKARMDNASSFELVEAKAMPGKTDDGNLGWIVGLTYRGTNGFGAVVTNNAIVSVDEQGETALKVIPIR